LKKIVLTGGPCSGKTTILQALREEFADSVVVVPEVATLLLANGFPVPGRNLPWSAEWQAALQAAILPLQQSLEQAYLLVAQAQGAGLVVCDRGTLDGAAYTPGGVDEFCRRFSLDLEEVLAHYDAVIHLESLATAAPEKYGKDGNVARFESLPEAQRLEQATRTAWARHARQLVIDGRQAFDSKVAEVLRVVRWFLA
jgi:predicted ATPase